jgi:hypothetical protein
VLSRADKIKSLADIHSICSQAIWSGHTDYGALNGRDDRDHGGNI